LRWRKHHKILLGIPPKFTNFTYSLSIVFTHP